MTNETDKTPAILDEISEALCKKLKEHDKKGVLPGCAEGQDVPFPLNKWEKSKHLKKNCEVSRVLEELIGKFGSNGKIYRKCISDMAEKIKDKNIDACTPQLKKIFLAAMVWGYADSDNRGPYRVSETTKCPDCFSMAVTESYRCIRNGKIEDAYNIFVYSHKLRMLGPAFFTKYLYFIGKPCKQHCEPRCASCQNTCGKLSPLILDERVARNLGRCKNSTKYKAGSIWELIDAYAKQEKKGYGDTNRYMGYVKGVHCCAAKLGEGIKPEDIEYFLFEYKL